MALAVKHPSVVEVDVFDGCKRVAVVEDDAAMRAMLRRVLAGGGFTPVLFSDAESLLAAREEGRAHCLVIDLRLPGISGLQLHAALARTGPTPPTIFITALDTPVARTAVRDAGGTYLVKPFSGRSLLAAVQTAIAR
jgi:FixJ family two-component response regulator